MNEPTQKLTWVQNKSWTLEHSRTNEDGRKYLDHFNKDFEQFLNCLQTELWHVVHQ